jgi:hypothetical protein
MEPYGSYRVNKGPSMVPIQSQIDPVHTTRSYLSKIHSNLHLGLPTGLIPSGFPTIILHALVFPTMHDTCPAHRILPDLIILIIHGKQYKLWSYEALH